MKGSKTPLAFALMLAALSLYWLYYSFYTPYTPQSTFYPQSEFARSSHGVYTFVNVLMLIIFVVIESWLVWAVFKYRRDDVKPGDPLPDQTHGNNRLELGLTAATTVLVIVLFVPSCQEIQFVQAEAPPDALEVKVVGKQWWWEFYYPEYDLVTANEVHVPKGRTVKFSSTSTDVIHAFWIPRLGGKRDAVPGREQSIWLTPDEAGTYDGQCAEFCGTSHALMSMQVIVDEPADFEKWLAGQKSPPPPDAMGKYFGTFAQSGCIACHNTMANDKSMRGQLGPNLTKVSSRKMIAAGVLDNTPENLREWIANPQHTKPGVLMDIPEPTCTGEGEPKACCRRAGIGNCLSDETLDTLVSYLQVLR